MLANETGFSILIEFSEVISEINIANEINCFYLDTLIAIKLYARHRRIWWYLNTSQIIQSLLNQTKRIGRKLTKSKRENPKWKTGSFALSFTFVRFAIDFNFLCHSFARISIYRSSKHLAIFIRLSTKEIDHIRHCFNHLPGHVPVIGPSSGDMKIILKRVNLLIYCHFLN